MSLKAKILEGVQVEWKELGDVVHFINAKPHEKLVDSNGDVALMTSRFISTEGKSVRYVKRENVLSPALKNDVAMVMSDLPNGKALAKTFFVEENKRFAANQRVCLLRVKDLDAYFPKFLHLVVNRNKQLLAYDNGLDQTHLKKDWILKIRVPIPCPDNPKKSLDFQKKIVAILDKFTALKAELTTELTTELTARKQQYSYYREQLFCFDENEVEYLPMGDESIGKFIRGGGLQKKDFTETGIGCIHYGQIYTYYGTYTDKTKSFVSEEFAKKARMAKSGDLVIATTSENDEDLCKAVAWLGEERIAVSSDACFYTHNLNPKYVAYFFQTNQFQKQKMPFITGAKVKRVNADSLAKIKIPVPSKEEQERVVSILDKIDVLTNHISKELPKEIELRQKQYEYYRDLLLTFPKDGISA